MLVSTYQLQKGNTVKYLDLTNPEDLEPTYTKAQKIGMGICGAGIVGIIGFAIQSMAQAQLF